MVAKKNGEVVDVVIGEDDNDPVFCVTDLLIHLSREQQTKPANTVVEGENLDASDRKPAAQKELRKRQSKP